MSFSPGSSVDSLPGLQETGSTSRLILLPNTDDRDPFQDYTTDDEDDNEEHDPQLAINLLSIPPLAPSVVFLCLLSPYLRLGAMHAFDIGNTPLPYSLTGLVVAASLSAFCRQIWFLLGRYLRKSSTEDILVYIFAHHCRRVPKHGFARYTVTTISGLFRLFLAAMYLRDSVESALHLKIELVPSLSRVNISISLSILVFVLSLPRSLGSKSVTYATSLSMASYLAWLVAISRSYVANQPPIPRLNPFGRGILWNEISSLAFACSTTISIPLSTSLMAGTPCVSSAPGNARTKSFQLLNVFSAMLGAILILPLVIMATPPRAPTSKVVSDNFILGLRIATLVLSIPSVVVSITLLPLHGLANRFISTDLALSLITLVILALSLAPPTMTSILNDVMLFVAVFGGFLLPALAHITIHYFRRPLSIVVAQQPSSAPSTPRPSDGHARSPSPSRDPLLQRKERLLQRRRFGQRLFWDAVSWIVLIPICACALVWAVGRLAGRW